MGVVLPIYLSCDDVAGKAAVKFSDFAGHGGRTMKHTSIKAAVAGLVLVLMSGCASGTALTRGQSPEAYRGAPQGPQGRGIQPVNYTENDQYYNAMQMDPAAQVNCAPGGFGHDFCAPPQSHRFQYVVPQGLNYPPPNAMPGVVQYPYYTVKGPDCFFHQ